MNDHDICGEFDCRRDDRGRLRLPAEIVHRHKEDNGDFNLRVSSDGCLVLYPIPTWNQDAEKVKNLDSFKKNVRIYQRMFFEKSKRVTVDNNGRIIPPASMAESVGIDRDVKIIGVGDRYEIWNPDTYLKQKDELTQEEIEAIEQEIFGFKAISQ